MDTSLADRLLACLRGRLGARIAFAEPPAPLSGGFDTTILAFRLHGAAGEWSNPLVLRVMTRSDAGPRVLREAAAHAAVVEAGFPAPSVLLAEPEVAPLGLPFLIMQRLPGQTMWTEAARSRAWAGFLAMPHRLAEIGARLHRVHGGKLRGHARALGLDPSTIGVAADVERLALRVEREGLAGLVPGTRWLVQNLPAPGQPEVVCHGDFHPLNVMMDEGRLSGVIDWANATIAEPSYDIAGLRVIALFADPGVPRWARDGVAVLRRLAVRRYMGAYRRMALLEGRNLRYYDAVRALSALAVAGEQRAQANGAWSGAHTKVALCGYFERISGVRVRI